MVKELQIFSESDTSAVVKCTYCGKFAKYDECDIVFTPDSPYTREDFKAICPRRAQ